MSAQSAMTPTPDIKNDIHLTHLEDDMWQVLVITHVWIDGVEVGQTTWCNIVSVRPKRVPV
jgi:hypothetical protein